MLRKADWRVKLLHGTGTADCARIQIADHLGVYVHHVGAAVPAGAAGAEVVAVRVGEGRALLFGCCPGLSRLLTPVVLQGAWGVLGHVLSAVAAGGARGKGVAQGFTPGRTLDAREEGGVR